MVMKETYPLVYANGVNLLVAKVTNYKVTVNWIM
jgi:hypothetical protein